VPALWPWTVAGQNENERSPRPTTPRPPRSRARNRSRNRSRPSMTRNRPQKAASDLVIAGATPRLGRAESEGTSASLRPQAVKRRRSQGDGSSRGRSWPGHRLRARAPRRPRHRSRRSRPASPAPSLLIRPYRSGCRTGFTTR